MKQNKLLIVFSRFVLIIAITVFLAVQSSKLWGDKQEKDSTPKTLVLESNMTVAQFGEKNNIGNPTLKQIFNLQSKSDLQRPLSDFHLSENDIQAKFSKSNAISQEEESKNWLKIRVKFGLWFLWLAVMLVIILRLKITPMLRMAAYACAVLVFGVALGSDPSPMGTVKDAIALYGSKKVVFIPRFIAMSILLALVLAANKFICSWGCQFGTLQDLLLRINRTPNDTKGIMKQYKIPFIVTNTFRILFLIVFTIVAFVWATDSIEPIDPFKIFKPFSLSGVGVVFVGIILIASLFIYRPWCHFFCPFGLVGWIVEKISIFRIKVNYSTCIACQSCAKACPSLVMDAILKRTRVIPDCFSCGSCIAVCPTQSVRFKAGRREKPPKDKFSGKSSDPGQG
ncbi:MAG: 4Fe-4S binding protein [Chitinivibrionales bacterium]|nr:4Fe-4S binding protein [Chitinivibrionales bacterium]